MIRTKIRQILVPLDGSKSSFRGLDEAIYIARQCNATITGVCAISVYPRNWGDIVNPLKTRLFEDAEKTMDRAEVISAQNGIVFCKRVEYGDVKSSLISLVKEHRFDLVVIGARGFGPVKETFLGSVSNAMLHRSKIPILVVK